MNYLVKLLTKKDSMSALEYASLVHKTGDGVTMAGAVLVLVGSLSHYRGVKLLNEALVNPLDPD